MGFTNLENVAAIKRTCIRGVIAMQQIQTTLDLVYTFIGAKSHNDSRVVLLTIDRMLRLLTIQICSLWRDDFTSNPTYKNSSIAQLNHDVGTNKNPTLIKLNDFLTQPKTTRFLDDQEDVRNKQFAHISAKTPRNELPYQFDTVETLIMLTCKMFDAYLLDLNIPTDSRFETGGTTISIIELKTILRQLQTMGGMDKIYLEELTHIEARPIIENTPCVLRLKTSDYIDLI